MARSLNPEGVSGEEFRVDPGHLHPGRVRVTQSHSGVDFLVLWEADETEENPVIHGRFIQAIAGPKY